MEQCIMYVEPEVLTQKSLAKSNKTLKFAFSWVYVYTFLNNTTYH